MSSKFVIPLFSGSNINRAKASPLQPHLTCSANFTTTRKLEFLRTTNNKMNKSKAICPCCGIRYFDCIFKNQRYSGFSWQNSMSRGLVYFWMKILWYRPIVLLKKYSQHPPLLVVPHAPPRNHYVSHYVVMGCLCLITPKNACTRVGWEHWQVGVYSRSLGLTTRSMLDSISKSTEPMLLNRGDIFLLAYTLHWVAFLN